MSSSSIPLDVQNLFEEQIDNRINAAIKRYDARSGEYPAVVTRKGGDGMWWCRVVGNEEETPIMTTLTDMEVGDTIRLLIKDGRTFAEGNETSPSATSTSVNTYVQASLNPVLADLKELSLDTATVKNLVAKKASIEDLEAEKAKIGDLQVITADISDIRANAAKVENLTAAQLEADHATVASLDTNYAKIQNGVIANATIGYADVNGLETAYARIDAANITEAIVKQTWADTIMVQTGLLAKEGTVYSLDAIEVNAVNITAGTLDVERLIVTIDDEKYVLSMSQSYALTADTAIYEKSSDKYFYIRTQDTVVDPNKTYYAIPEGSDSFEPVLTPVDQDLDKYYERVYNQFDESIVYYEYDSVTGEYELVDEPSSDDFGDYYQRIEPDKVYYEYDSQTEAYNSVELPQETELSGYYEQNQAADYSKIDGGVLEDRTVSGDKIIANSITAEEITADNIMGTGGWINLSQGTFRYVNAETGSGIAWDGQYLTLFGGYSDQQSASELINGAFGISGWLSEHAVPATETSASPDTVYVLLSDGSFSHVSYDVVSSTYSLSVDEEADSGKTYYERNEQYVLTEDTDVDSGKTYYMLDGGQYVVVSTPVPEELSSYYELTVSYDSVTPEAGDSPVAEGWYEKGNPSLQGLHVLDQSLYSFLSEHMVQSGDGTVLRDRDSGYSIKIGQDGFGIYDEAGNVVGKYGKSVQVGALSATHMEASGDVLMFLPAGISGTVYEAVQKAPGDDVTGLYVVVDGEYVLTDDILAVSGTVYYDKVPNIGQAVAYIAVSPEPPYESVFYMTRSIVVKDMFFGEGLWKWYKRSNNNMSLKWMGAM